MITLAKEQIKCQLIEINLEVKALVMMPETLSTEERTQLVLEMLTEMDTHAFQKHGVRLHTENLNVVTRGRNQ